MKLTFRGWKREVTTHVKTIVPVKSDGNSLYPDESGPLRWEGSGNARGQLTKLALNGDFLVEIQLEPAEARSWFLQFIAQHPEDSLRLLGELQTEAILALHRLPHTAKATTVK